MQSVLTLQSAFCCSCLVVVEEVVEVAEVVVVAAAVVVVARSTTKVDVGNSREHQKRLTRRNKLPCKNGEYVLCCEVISPDERVGVQGHC